VKAAASQAQNAAAVPDRSSWVAANAGSGKTRVLTDRVARLLLAGTEPQKILCLTYTKAAAAEMQTRLYGQLGSWAMMPEGELRAALAALGEPGASLPRDRLDRARTLFARALETPGGLRIQTIHAFCDALLRRFPLEAGVAPGFTVLEDRQARALRAEVLDSLAADGAPELSALATHLGGDDPDALLREIGQARAAFAAPFAPEALAARLGIDPSEDAAGLAARVIAGDGRDILRALVPVLAGGKASDQKAAERLAAALDRPDAALVETLEAVFLYGADAAAPFGARTDRFPTKDLRAAHPGLMAPLDALMRRVEDGRSRRLGIAAFARSVALDAFARRWLAALSARKAALGLLDFDDLVERAQGLFERPETAAWVLWRLDGGIDHILVDEAQDTSPAQWRVIEAISAEFFAGVGAREGVERTIFVVGDEKQSIYSFQGAEPAAFGRMRDRFASMLDGLERALQSCDLIYSFRSAQPILDLVDAVFAGPAGDQFGAAVKHDAVDPDAPGRVELWPFLEPDARAEEPPWDAPLDMPGPDDPAARLAERIATTIRDWLDAGRVLPGAGGRAIRAGDLLILVQRRGAVFDAVIRALKRAEVPVAGADVLRVGGELAVRDLLAALRVAATPADDLSLAAFLRSPIGGLSERDLFALAHGRTGTLWQALNAAEPAPAAREILRDLRAQADFLRPFEMLQRLLIRHDGRRRLIARLRAEAEDGIDALLDLALAYERVEPPSLTGFLDWIDRDTVTVKRRMEEDADQVRVMTVHGAKGLEAPIVILPDTAQRPEGAHPPQLLRLGDGAVWRTRAEDSPPLFAAAEADRRAAVAAENRRLLYVALTRAARWLIVAGAGRTGASSWHAMVAEALDRLSPVVEPGPDGPVRSLSHGWSDATAGPAAAPGAEAVLSAWARRPPPAPVGAPPPIAPSMLGGAHALPGEGADETEALARGAALHLLLEALPARPRADWPDLAARLLADRPDREALLAEALAVLDHPDLAPLFAAGTLPEVELTAPIAALGGRRLAGRIDRLVVTPDRVLAVDFKSNRVLPTRPEETPEAILRQLGAYAAALAPIWPGRNIATAVLWTRGPVLMEIPAALAEAALQRAARLDPALGGS
jgi:ATP-dependent helicase/nuclease subunit A